MVFLRGPVLLNLQEVIGLGQQDVPAVEWIRGEVSPHHSVGLGVVAKRNNSRLNNNQTPIRRWFSLKLNH